MIESKKSVILGTNFGKKAMPGLKICPKSV